MQKKYNLVQFGKKSTSNQLGGAFPNKSKSAHHFHHVSTPLGQQLQALQRQVEELPVLSVRLLSLLAAWACDHLEKTEHQEVTNVQETTYQTQPRSLPQMYTHKVENDMSTRLFSASKGRATAEPTWWAHVAQNTEKGPHSLHWRGLQTWPFLKHAHSMFLT